MSQIQFCPNYREPIGTWSAVLRSRATTFAPMILAAIGDTSYNIILFLHVLSAMVAFAPVFMHPALSGLDPSKGVWGALTGSGAKVYAPALILTGVLGFGVAGLSDEVYSMSDGWLIAALLVWIAQNGVLHALVIPGESAWKKGDSSAAQKVSLGSGLIAALLVLQLVLMIFKPGA